ncbi:RG9MTD [Mytilus edulis]|uniref:tRNA (guanine(9)-N(1))-methyltransferase n=1 Tax=Mytilus edulis TaxID=6550 RepID=A0A8S3TMY2_MYTED|nr:RG9MTD [Mytilus edulis]
MARKETRKRAKEKLKKKQRRQEARDRGETLGPTRKMLKLNSMEKSTCKVKVVLDCSFDEYMNDKDIMKLTKQVGFCYSANRRAENPLQFYVCGLHGQMQQRLESIGDYKNWDEKKSDTGETSSNLQKILHPLQPCNMGLDIEVQELLTLV